VTVLFADLKGSMELLADRDPEEARKILDPVLERMMEAVHRYEGTVNQVMGDGIMALFGAPLAQEDHAIRACYAALWLQETVRLYAEEVRRAEGIPIQIRVGLNSGEVVVRSIGSDLRMDYTAVGQTTHLAARMEQMATPGTILLTRDTFALAEGFVQVAPLGPMGVKGLPSPIEVFELTSASRVRSRLQAAAARGLTRFVGRDAEIELLSQALERAGGGRGQVVAIVGEPGVGKSRLVLQFTHSHRTRDWLVLEAASVSYGKATTYFPVIELLKSYFQIEPRDDARKIREKLTGKLLSLDRALEPTLPALLSLLDIPVDDPEWARLDPPQRRRQTLDSLKRLLLRESQVQQVLLVFEDLHWIDSETQALLDTLVGSVPTAHVLLLISYRPEYTHAWGSKTYYQQLRLDVLPAATVDEFIDVLVGRDTSVSLLKRLLIERTEGNPFFLEEAVRALAETKMLVGERGAYRLASPIRDLLLPTTAQAILAARIDRLAPEDKRLLQAAAVVGKDVPFVLLQAIADEPEQLRAGLAQLQTAEFLYEAQLFPDLAYTFKHALTHQVAYESLVQDRRKALHARTVEALEQLYGGRLGEHAEALAYHAVRAESWVKSVDYLRLAGAAAYARGSMEASAERYVTALDVLPRLPSQRENLERAIDVRLESHAPLFASARFHQLVELHRGAETLARQLGDTRRLGHALVRLGVYAWIDARYSDGEASLRQALGIIAASGDTDLAIAARYVSGECAHAVGDYQRAIDVMLPNVDGPDANAAKAQLWFAFSPYVGCCGFLGWCALQLGALDDAQCHVDRAVQEADASRQAQAQVVVYVYRALLLLRRGDFHEAVAWSSRSVRIAEGGSAWLSAAWSMHGRILASLGQYGEALEYLEQGAALHEKRGIRWHLGYFTMLWAEGLRLAGRQRAAIEIGERASALARTTGERGVEAESLCVLADAHFANDSVDRAAELYAAARILAEKLGMRPLVAHCHLGLGKLYRRTDKREQAQEHLATATTMYREMGMTYWLEKAEAELIAL
jgi:class 3 adenylate cyclase/tetratricopeptide (TPR) repeat protein